MDELKKTILSALAEVGLSVTDLEKPPKSDMGDFALPCFTFAKEQKKSPAQIAQELAEKLNEKLPQSISVKPLGPYLNFIIEQSKVAGPIVQKILSEKDKYGFKPDTDKVILIESPGPNTNKPLHLGHLRNMLLGHSLSRILSTQGSTVKIVNILNDRGVHICKSMLAYERFGEGKKPEDSGVKSDHFVGDFYVKYAQEAENNPALEDDVQEMLVKWENEDPEVRALWKTMNTWAIEGFHETYAVLNFVIDKEYAESDIYLDGREVILKGLNDGIFEKDEKGAVVVTFEDTQLGKKVLLRANGTAVYITQDIVLAKKRYEDYTFDEMIYVVGNEQEYHFRVLFEIFKKFNWPFAGKCSHFSYGMVELPDGKMKSRQGNVIDTDTLIDDVSLLAQEEVRKRYKDLSEEEIIDRSRKIALASIRFFFLKYDPLRNFVFNPKESLSFEGETGPYVLYAYARMCSIFRKHGKADISGNLDLLDTEQDKSLGVVLSEYPAVLTEAAKQYKPSLLCTYLITLAGAFNAYYRDNPILKADDNVRDARLMLLQAVQHVLRSGLELLGIDVLEQM
ncbi:MAG: arginine--tRNA ligase [Candidatus Woesearchaeota archaeon]